MSDLSPANAHSGPPVRLLLLGGIGRSGSTLLDRLLGQMPGHVSIGEMGVRLWDRCLRQNWPCGCGQPFRSCPFWSEVGEKAFNGWDNVDVDTLVKQQRVVNQTRKVPKLLAPSLVPGDFRDTLDSYLANLTRVYAAIRDVSGAQVVVDSSKAPSLPYMLRHAPGVEVTIAHIIRDPRGVAYSWTKKKENRAETAEDGGPAYMPTIKPRKVARRWMTINSMVAALPRLGVPVVRLRYEDVIPDPAGQLAKVAQALGEDVRPEQLDFVHDGGVELLPAHTSSGNPNRFDTGFVPLRLDEAWREKFPADSRRTVERITLPLRAMYGYRP